VTLPMLEIERCHQGQGRPTRCRTHPAVKLSFETDGDGRLIEWCEECAHEKRMRRYLILLSRLPTSAERQQTAVAQTNGQAAETTVPAMAGTPGAPNGNGQQRGLLRSRQVREPERPTGKFPSAETQDRLREAFHQGRSIAEAARIVGCSQAIATKVYDLWWVRGERFHCPCGEELHRHRGGMCSYRWTLRREAQARRKEERWLLRTRASFGALAFLFPTRKG